MANALSTVGSYQSIDVAPAAVAPAQRISGASDEVCDNETCRKVTASCGCVILVLGGILVTVGAAVHSKELVAAGIVTIFVGFASCFSSLSGQPGSSRGGSMPMGLR